MLCKVKEDEKPLDSNWIIEEKFDGSRCMFKDNQLIMRNSNIDRKDRFRHIYNELKNLNVVLDGELCVFDDNGVSNFNKLQQKIFWKNVVYMIFDILELNGIDLRKKPLRERKEILREFSKNFKQFVKMNDSYKFDKNLIENWKQNKLEGYVAKHLSSPYIEARNGYWLKHKFLKFIDSEIVGYNKPEKTGNHGSLLCSINNGRTTFSVGLLSNDNRDEYFKYMPKFCEVRYLELTKDERLRQPIFEKFKGENF